MSTTLSTRFACGHVQRSSTTIGTEREKGLKGLIRRMSSKKLPQPVTADSAQFCSVCRNEPHPPPLRSHPIARAPKPEEVDEDDINPYANEFAQVPKYGAHDFTRKHPDDIDENTHREAIPITPSRAPSEPQNHPETNSSLSDPEISPKFADRQSILGKIERAIRKKSKKE